TAREGPAVESPASLFLSGVPWLARERFEIARPVEIRGRAVEKLPLQKIPRLRAAHKKWSIRSDRPSGSLEQDPLDVIGQLDDGGEWATAAQLGFQHRLSVRPDAHIHRWLTGSLITADAHRQPAGGGIEHRNRVGM